MLNIIFKMSKVLSGIKKINSHRKVRHLIKISHAMNLHEKCDAREGLCRYISEQISQINVSNSKGPNSEFQKQGHLKLASRSILFQQRTGCVEDIILEVSRQAWFLKVIYPVRQLYHMYMIG